jgi:ATP-dependent DNA helicase RecQ
LTQAQLRTLKKTLRSQFQFKELRPGQEDVIRSILDRQNTLAIMPTGGGKSLCYQLPALHLKGTTVVISPLISLMKDQREKMEEFGITALEFNSLITKKQQTENMDKFQESEEEFIFATPERMQNPEFLKALKKIHIDFIVIDEAHCVSQWGHDFRPAFLDLRHALKTLGNPPVLALTATATTAVVADIQEQLQLKDLQVFRTSLHRDNLFFEAQHVENDEEKKLALLENIREMEGGSGIIYASSIKAVEEIQNFLVEQGIPALKYHGKLKSSEREANQNEFMNNSPRIIVATNAFGMGIDKTDIRFVIHYNFPGSLEAYYQEAGRAGRDGEASRCILLYLKKDKSTQTFFIARKYPSLDDLTQMYLALQQRAVGNGEILKSEFKIETLSDRKTSLLISYLKQLEVIKEKRGGILKLTRTDLNSTQLAFIADNYKKRHDGDQEKLRQVIIYAQSAMCRWKILTNYFDEEVEWQNCEHCDNCQNVAVKEIVTDNEIENETALSV